MGRRSDWVWVSQREGRETKTGQIVAGRVKTEPWDDSAEFYTIISERYTRRHLGVRDVIWSQIQRDSSHTHTPAQT